MKDSSSRTAGPPHILTAPSPHPLAADVRLICFDVDGTIMTGRHRISDKTAAAFHVLHQKGILLSLATGRPLFGVRTLLEQFPFEGPCSLFGGALIHDAVSGETIHEAFLPPEAIHALLAVCRKQRFYLELYTRDNFFTEAADSRYPEIHAEYLGQAPGQLSDLTSIAEQPVYKAVVVIPRSLQEESVSRLSREVPECIPACSPGAAHPEITFINITAANCSRHVTFEALISHLGILPRQVISFGDGETDREFLKAAGIGIAMEAASDAVQGQADFVTDDVETDGVYTAVSRLFGLY